MHNDLSVSVTKQCNYEKDFSICYLRDDINVCGV